jgi:hypothetical protein
MSRLITKPNFDDPDAFYSELIALHDGRDKAESEAVNARLILLLANHIGELAVLREAFALAESEP